MSKTRTAAPDALAREEMVPGAGCDTGPEISEVAASGARVVPLVKGTVPSVL